MLPGKSFMTFWNVKVRCLKRKIFGQDWWGGYVQNKGIYIILVNLLEDTNIVADFYSDSWYYSDEVNNK